MSVRGWLLEHLNPRAAQLEGLRDARNQAMADLVELMRQDALARVAENIAEGEAQARWLADRLAEKSVTREGC